MNPDDPSSSDPTPADPIFAGLDVRRGERARALLSKVVDRARGSQGIVVFDLDSTLLDNKARQAQIMAEYGQQNGVEALSAVLAEHWDGWDYRQAMRNAGLVPDEIEAHVEDYREFWRERFFTSAYCRVDQEVPGSPAYVQAVRRVGAKVFYVTGRQETMRPGTLESFERVGLPLPDDVGVQLWMKPTLEEDDDDFKARVHAELHGLGDPVAAFDNEPIHINAYRRSFPEALIVHLATDHSMRDVLVDPAIPSIADFSDWKP